MPGWVLLGSLVLQTLHSAPATVSLTVVAPYPTVEWTQHPHESTPPAEGFAEVQGYVYRYHLDVPSNPPEPPLPPGVAFPEVTCVDGGRVPYTCHAKLPVNFNGPHTLFLTVVRVVGEEMVSGPPSATISFEIRTDIPTTPGTIVVTPQPIIR